MYKSVILFCTRLPIFLAFDSQGHYDQAEKWFAEHWIVFDPLRDADGHVFESLIQYPIVFLDLSELSERFKSQPVCNSKGDTIYVVRSFLGAQEWNHFAWQHDQNCD